MERLRVATLQYFIRPVSSFDQFADQVTALVDTAADYGCHLVVFPEYFTIQLLTLGNTKSPIAQQVHELADYLPRYLALMSECARARSLYIVGGTIPVEEEAQIYNKAFVFGPGGETGSQGKLHMTRFEREDWFIKPSRGLTIFDTDFGKLAVAICYDVEFPEMARAAARLGANILCVPSCTDDRQGFLRVRYCAQARAIENQMYVIHSCTVGSLPNVPAVSLNYGQASILTPSDFAFSRDGILAEGIPNQETIMVGELNLETIVSSRDHGTVLPLNDSRNTADLLSRHEVLKL